MKQYGYDYMTANVCLKSQKYIVKGWLLLTCKLYINKNFGKRKIVGERENSNYMSLFQDQEEALKQR